MNYTFTKAFLPLVLANVIRQEEINMQVVKERVQTAR